MTTSKFREYALALPGTIEQSHFDRLAFKVKNKRIFATLHKSDGSVNVRLPLVDQDVFSKFGNGAVYPVPNKWGHQGWTTFELGSVSDELLLDALETAYNDVFRSGREK